MLQSWEYAKFRLLSLVPIKNEKQCGSMLALRISQNEMQTRLMHPEEKIAAEANLLWGMVVGVVTPNLKRPSLCEKCTKFFVTSKLSGFPDPGKNTHNSTYKHHQTSHYKYQTKKNLGSSGQPNAATAVSSSISSAPQPLSSSMRPKSSCRIRF